MKTLRTRVCSARLFGSAFAALLLATTFAPASVAAHDGHEQGNVIANANGDRVLLRLGPSYQDSEITRFPEGTHVDIVDGPYDADDGSVWYQVSIESQLGYMVSDYLVAEEESGSEGTTSGTAITNDSVFLRSGPSTADAVVKELPAGEKVTLTGGSRDGWNSVSATGGDGWVFSDYLTFGSSAQGTRYTIDTVHLRSGPGTGYSSIAYLEIGVELEMTGEQEDGFVKVTSSLGDGWVAAQYIGSTSPGQPDPDPSGETGTRYTIDTVHLRSGPATGTSSISYLDSGVQLTLTGEQDNGFVSVSTAFGDGWVAAQYIGAEAPAGPENPEDPGETGTRYTIDTVHLRSGPGTSHDSIAYLEIGVQLELTGAEENGFVAVSSSLGDGWVFAEYIGVDAPEDPEEPEEPHEPTAPVTRYTTSAVNLRSGSNQTATVITVLPYGAEVQFAGVTVDGFSQVTSSAGSGWVSSEFLSETMPEAPQEPEPSTSLVTWPVEGGEWYVSQGYNGSSHQNRTQYWQYYYSFDLKRSDGSTTGQPIYSAVNGTIRWIDEATGGMSIYMGDGLAYAFFHANLDPSLQEGDVVTQGQYMGTIAPDGQASNGGTAHLHITVWETADEGNWSRQAIPFTGNVAISGESFPDEGSGNDYRGYTFTP